MSVSAADCRARFRALHAREQLFLMPNPWDIGSARLLESAGFEALATTSAGFAWSIGKLDHAVTRDDLVAHVASLAAAVSVPLNVDSERCYPDDPGGVAETVALLAAAGAAGFSVEDYNPSTGAADTIDVAAERVALAAEANRRLDAPMVLTGRAEAEIHTSDDLDDIVARLCAYRDAGADAVYAPRLSRLDQIAKVVSAVGVPLNVLATGPTMRELASVGVRRVSTGSALAASAYQALVVGAQELLTDGTSTYRQSGVSDDVLTAAFSPAGGARRTDP
jgi:2-methylisocitrate lyase-like PEP mutase family enzyme